MPNKLTSFSVGNLINLKEIILNNNKINNIPDDIGNLVNLKRFYISNNNIEEIPESFGKLESLTIAALDGNKIKKIPESISGCVKLDTLHLQNNRLESLPDVFTSLNLKELLIYRNRLNRLLDSLDKVKVDYLFADNNPFNTITSA